MISRADSVCIRFAALAGAMLALALAADAQTPDVEVKSLSGITAFGFEPAAPLADALPIKGWAGGEAATAETLLTALAPPASGVALSPAAWRLAVSAVASPSSTPDGADGETGGVRFLALAKVGRLADLRKGLAQIRSAADSPSGRRAAAVLALYQGADAEACAVPGLALTPGPAKADPAALAAYRFSAELRSFCAANGNDVAGAEAGLAGLKAAGLLDPWFDQTVHRLLKKPAGKGNPPARLDQPLYARVSAALDLPRTAAAIAVAPPAQLLAIIADQSTPAAVRLAAIEQALMAGALEAGSARALVAAVPDLAANAPSLKNRFILQAFAEGVAAAPERRTAVIAAALRRQKTYPAFAALAGLLAPELESIMVDPTNAALGAVFARAALANGQTALALRFVAAATGPGGIAADDPNLVRMKIALALEDDARTVADSAFGRIAAAQALGPAAQTAAIRDAFILAGATGLRLDAIGLAPEILNQATGGGALAPLDRARLTEAARAHGVSESALAAANALGRISGASLSAADAHEVLAVLVAAGLAGEAKALAREWLIADLAF